MAGLLSMFSSSTAENGADDFRTKNTKLPPSSADVFATTVQEYATNPTVAAVKHTASKRAKKALPFLRPAGRINARQQLDKSLQAHEAVVQDLLKGGYDFPSSADIEKAKASSIGLHMMRTATDKELRDRVVDDTANNSLPFPRRWYDSIIPPWVLPWDHRETVVEAVKRMRVVGDAAAWRTERNARPQESSNRSTGTAVFCCAIVALTVTPVAARLMYSGPVSPECFDPTPSEFAGCTVNPYPVLPVYCAAAIICLFKLSTLDMTVGPYGALPFGLSPEQATAQSLRFVKEPTQHTVPRILSGAVPESEREGVYGYVEMFVAIWHGILGSFAIVMIILFLDFSTRMNGGVLRAMTGGSLPTGSFIMGKAGILDDSSADISECVTVSMQDIPLVANEFFGIRNLILFMCGAVLFGMGELFKLRAVQLWPAKGYLNMDIILRISKPWIWASEVGEVNKMASMVAEECWKRLEGVRLRIEELDEVQSFQKAAKDRSTPKVHHMVEELRDLTSNTLKLLMDSKTKARNIAQLNRSRILWAAVLQSAAIGLWVPASEAQISPCLRPLERSSFVGQFAQNATDRLELLSFGSICVLIASVCFLAYMPFIPMNLQSMMICNPGHWHFKAPFMKETYESLHPAKYWLPFVVDGLLLIYLGNCIFFGQLGSDWVPPEQDQTWLYVSPWALWKLQIYLYASELTVRWIGSNLITGRGIVRPSLAEEACYTAQVQANLLETIYQVGDVAGPFHDVQQILGSVSAEIRNLALEYNKATKFESSSESEEGEPVHGWAKVLVDDLHHPPEVPEAIEIEDGVPPGTVQEFIIDNRWLNASTDGLGYRNSKNMDDHDMSRPVAPWFSSVWGVDMEDGWVRLEDGSYLPSFVGEHPVLTVPQEDEADAETGNG
eukprot:TRINITY_DN12385_c0_g1_i1.p1 TRINITY_DN12385_c0_g1~~TRINITY_DN12385_c0_g1_i1.p1  ORF type:complete len:897 (+),score=168.57 TRINITY_DN12385_c0_g1_i1:109-2799(+)